MKKRDKNAVSPMVATVILIVIVISAGVIIYVWSKGFIAEQLEKFGNPVETTCDKIDFAVQLESTGTTSYELLINNRANVDIHKININFNKKGKSIVKTFSPDGGSIKKGSTGKVYFDLSTLELSSFDSIDVTPVLLATTQNSKQSKIFPCESKTKEDIKT